MKKTPAILLTLLVLFGGVWNPPAGAQGGLTPQVDVSVVGVRFQPNMTVNETITVYARVNTTGPAIVDVTFTWNNDGAPLRPGTLPGTVDSTTRVRFTAQGPASQETAPITFQPPFERRGEQEVRIVATVRNAQDTNETNNTLIVKSVVRFPKLNITYDHPPVLDVVPRGEAILRYFVRNDGNVPDNVTPHLELDQGQPFTVEAWPLPVVPPGQSVTGILVVRPNETTVPNPANLSLNVTARSGIASSGDARMQAPILHINETMYNRRPTVAIDPLPPNVQVFPGEERALLFTVRNTGDVDHLVRVAPRIDFSPVGWNASMRVPAGWPANLSTPPPDFNGSYPVPLRPNESAVLQVNLTRALVAPNLTALLRLEVNSTNGDRIQALTGGDLRARASTLLSGAGPDLTVNVSGSIGSVYQGDVPAFRFEVRNVGRGNATNATLHLELRDNLRTVEEADVRVPPILAGASATLTWSPSTAGLRGAYVMLGRVIANASQVDQNPENNTVRADLRVRAPFLSVRAPETLTAVPGGRLLLAATENGLSVENQGAEEELVVARLEPSMGPGRAEWLRKEWRVTVPPMSRMPLSLEVDVPAIPGAESIPATFTAEVEARPRFTASQSLAIHVDDVEAPRLTLVSPTAPSQVGKEARLAVRALDASGIRRAEVLLQSPLGERTSLPLQRDASDADVFVTRHTPAHAGTYVLEFRVEDASLVGRPATLGNVTWVVAPPSYAGVKPANFGEGAFVGAAPLRFVEAKNGTTRTLLVDVGDGLRSVPAPYGVSLPPVEGRRLVVVRATSTDGTVWEGRWNVTVDLTPPALSDPVSRDAGSGKVALEVRAEGAREVTARFETDGGPVEVTLPGRGSGVFGATVTAPASWKSVTFLGKDEAGNVGSAVAGPSANPTPGPGLWLVGLALAAVALALRRR